MLTASEIAAQIARGEVGWSGELRGDGLLLRLGATLQLLADPGQTIDLASQDSIDTLYTQTLRGWDEYELVPGQMILCSVDHSLRLGAAFAAAIASLSHVARLGLATHVTSPWVMPGWDGYLTLELVNTGPAGSGCIGECLSPGPLSGPCRGTFTSRKVTSATANPSSSAADTPPSSAGSSSANDARGDRHGLCVLRRVRCSCWPRARDPDHL
jgi:deoxycytidine triphosphate deaminase